MVHLLRDWKNYTIAALLASLVTVAAMPPVQASFSPTIVKSIQCNDVSINNGNATGTSTITAVVVAKSVPIFLGADTSSDQGEIELTNTTTVTGRRAGTSGNQSIEYCVVEFY